MKRYLLLLILLPVVGFSQPEVYPPHWWTGMKTNTIQLMIYGKDIGAGKPAVTLKHAGVSITKVHYVENPNYLFVDLTIGPKAAAGKFDITIRQANTVTAPYTLKPKRSGNGTTYAQGVTSSDFIYLIMPDRFSNGDPANDKIAGMRDQSLNRDS